MPVAYSDLPSSAAATLVEQFAHACRLQYNFDAVRVWLLDPPDALEGKPLLVAMAGERPKRSLHAGAVLGLLRAAEPQPLVAPDAAGFPLVVGEQRIGYVEIYCGGGFAPEVIAEIEQRTTRLAASVSSAEGATRGTILVCDDDPGVRALLARVLARRGFRVLEAENGLLALEQAKRRRPDLIVLDWLMPVMDGRDALERLKAEPETREIPVLMLTSQSSVDDKVAALDAGAQDFVTKPFDQRELVARLEQQLRWRKLLAGVAVRRPHAPPERRDAFEYARAGAEYLRMAGTMYLSAAELAQRSIDEALAARA